jgi:ligand-binding SRPBCC domain-containing protein
LHVIERVQLVPLPAGEAFAFFADAFNLEAITPPWLRFRILTPRPIAMREGAVIDYRLSLHRVPYRWHTRIDTWVPGRRFVDRQVRGPFGRWEHAHMFESRPGGTLIRDLVSYQMPFGLLGEVARRVLIGRDLERIFDYRYAAIERLLGRDVQSENPGGASSSG